MSDVINNERFRILLRVDPVEALQLLHECYAQDLLKIAYRFTRDEEASRDIVQETFLHVWSRRKELSKHHEKSIQHYLARTVRNMSVSYFRRKRHLSIDDFQFLNLYRYGTVPFEDALMEEEIVSKIRDFIATFPIRERQCFLMKIDEGMSLDRIAEMLGISRKMVEKSQTHALKRLREWVNVHVREG